MPGFPRLQCKALDSGSIWTGCGKKLHWRQHLFQQILHANCHVKIHKQKNCRNITYAFPHCCCHCSWSETATFASSLLVVEPLPKLGPLVAMVPTLYQDNQQQQQRILEVQVQAQGGRSTEQ